MCLCLQAWPKHVSFYTVLQPLFTKCSVGFVACSALEELRQTSEITSVEIDCSGLT